MKPEDFEKHLKQYYAFSNHLGDEPNCPKCNKKLVKIIYGMPTSEIIEKSERKEIYLGGCGIVVDGPMYYCYNCNNEYYKNLKIVDYNIEN